MSPFEPQRHRDKEAHGKQMRYEILNNKDERLSQKSQKLPLHVSQQPAILDELTAAVL
jgi:hypothetical protein